MLHCLIIALLDNKIKKNKNMRLVRNFRKLSVPIGKKMPPSQKRKGNWVPGPGFDNPGQWSNVCNDVYFIVILCAVGKSG